MNVTYFDPAQAHAAENPLGGVKIHWRYVKFGAMATCSVLAVVYLLMLNSLATQGFDLESLKAQQLTLHKELEAVDINLAIPSSLYALESNELIQTLPEADEKQFLALDKDSLAYLQQE